MFASKRTPRQEEKRRAFAFRRFLLFFLFLLAGCGGATPQAAAPPVVASPLPEPTRPAPPKVPPLAESSLQDSILRAGDYLIRQQLSNGELSYQVNFFTGERAYSPSHVRLIGGVGALYTACRVLQEAKYCQAGDLALRHYSFLLTRDETKFKGACLYAEGYCPLGGAALTIDAIYKRWQAGSGLEMDGENLLNTAVELGYFIVSLRKPQGGFYHAFDPHAGGAPKTDYFAANFPGESLLALLELYEMTGDPFWLNQAREVNAYMITQPVAEDQWHAYALSRLARLDALSEPDLAYAEKIAEAITLGEARSLHVKNSGASAASKLEGLAALAQAFALAGKPMKQLDAEMPLYVTFVRARQLPENDCGWELSPQTQKTFDGGIYANCEDPTIRVDALQNWINGLTAYLEYLGMQP